eukprot:NODE_7_length_67686_cov_1.621421.p55 type:complete len:119 gc:universal NODE_7_length_67686_cov_1.621421:53414-53058(-)
MQSQMQNHIESIDKQTILYTLIGCSLIGGLHSSFPSYNLPVLLFYYLTFKDYYSLSGALLVITCPLDILYLIFQMASGFGMFMTITLLILKCVSMFALMKKDSIHLDAQPIKVPDDIA